MKAKVHNETNDMGKQLKWKEPWDQKWAKKAVDCSNVHLNYLQWKTGLIYRKPLLVGSDLVPILLFLFFKRDLSWGTMLL